MEFDKLIENQEIELAEIDLGEINAEEKKDNMRENQEENKTKKLFK